MPTDGHIEMEKDEYVILYPAVEVDYQDVKVHADKITANLRTKDVVAEGHVVVDQGPQRISASHAVFNLESKTGTVFDAPPRRCSRPCTFRARRSRRSATIPTA